MHSQDVRRKFLAYFEQKGHQILPSSPVIPHEDPTLLFNNAGMNQFKDIFLGKTKRLYPTATTAQKCIRAGGKHNDLENVGHTTRHLTFFEMLGNFSFGEYFKKEAIAFAWECVTEVLELSPDRLWASVFLEDDEAYDLWLNYLPKERIVRFDEKENFWSMGELGPCGPCTELYYDLGEVPGEDIRIEDDEEGRRFLECWNLVFMQYNRQEDGTLLDLPNPSIDTGMGLERMVAIKNGVSTIFETDVLLALRKKVEALCGKVPDYQNYEACAPYNVIADHLRTLAFAIADGAQPGNTDRGYVLRKILRRAVRYGRKLSLQEPFLGKLVPVLVEMMGEDYPELKQSAERIKEILFVEEESFFRTLLRGGGLLGEIIEKAKSNKTKILGSEAFKLKDTYGFPIEEILLIAKDEGVEVDLVEYEKLSEEAKELSRSSRKVTAQIAEESAFQEVAKTEFCGYDCLRSKGLVVALMKDGKSVSSLKEGEEGLVFLDKTPFYAEMGGQVGDQGLLRTEEGLLVCVSDCQSPHTGLHAHVGKVSKGSLELGQEIIAEVHEEKRKLTECNHSATHLLHWALQKVLGEHAKQAGSVVDCERLRFDFSHHKGLSLEDLRAIEDLVNAQVREDAAVETYELSFAEVQKKKEIKQFFGDKYGDKVRVVDMGNSKELCGGTHTSSLGSIGLFKVLKEGSISSGVRRIEAVTGKAAEKLVRDQEDTLLEAFAKLKVKPHKFLERVDALLVEKKELQAEIKKYQKASAQNLRQDLLREVESVKDFSLLTAKVPFGGKEFRELAKELLGGLKEAVVVLAYEEEGKCQLLAAVSPSLHSKGIQAGALIKEIAPLVQGRGGGKADFAQAGGEDPKGIPAALKQAKEWLSKL